MIGLASPLRRHRLADHAFDEAVERLLADHDLESHHDESGSGSSSAALDLRVVTTAAVDPLEIAAALEAVGVRPRQVRERFGRSDVFDLAHDIYERVPLRTAAVEQAGARAPAPGGRRDLLRGAVFAVPGIAFTDVLAAGGAHVAWWALPFALTLGWALSQVTAMLGHALRNRRDAIGGRRLVTWVLALGTVLAGVGALVTWQRFGGSATSVVVAVVFVEFMLASGVLLLYEEEHVLAWALVPATLAYAAALVSDGSHRWGQVAVALEVFAAIVVLAGALRHATLRFLGGAKLVAGDAGDALRHLLHGACCGALVSVVLMLALRTAGRGVSELVTWPLLVTLGVMEWQLRSFRAAIYRLRTSLGSLDRFASSTWRAFLRAMGCYTAAVAVACGAVALALLSEGRSVPLRPLLVQVLLGVVLCADLVVLTCGGIRRVLRCWLTGALAGGGVLAVLHARGAHLDPGNAWWVALGAAGVVGVALFATASRVVRSPLN